MNTKNECIFKVKVLTEHDGIPAGSVVNIYDDSLVHWYKGLWTNHNGTYPVKVRKILCDKLPDELELIKNKIDELEKQIPVEKALLDIACDVEEELLRNCKKLGLDDCQTDKLSENVIAVFSLNREKYIRALTNNKNTTA